MNWKQLFPQFEPELIEVIEKEAVQRSFNAGDIIMRTGQYIKSTALVLEGQIKIYDRLDTHDKKLDGVSSPLLFDVDEL